MPTDLFAESGLAMATPTHRAPTVTDLSLASVVPIRSQIAARLVTAHHYLHRRPPISHAFGIRIGGTIQGVVTYGVPASRHLQLSACPTDPGAVLELNRLWLDDALPANSESWFVSRTLRRLPPRIVVSYADPAHGHLGYIYRALNFRYAGWTDMERVTPRYDYIPVDPSKHTRDAMRSGFSERRRRVAKVKYWTVTGTKADRRRLVAACGWPSMSWQVSPPPVPTATESVETARRSGYTRQGVAKILRNTTRSG